MGSGEYWPNDPFKSLEGFGENIKKTSDTPVTTEIIKYKANLSTNNDDTQHQKKPSFFKNLINNKLI